MTEAPAPHTEPGRHASTASLVGVVVAVVVIDQLTKAWAVSTLSTRTIHVVWTLQFHLAYNTGMAFGRGRSVGPIIGAFAMLVIVGLLITMRRGGGKVANLAVGLVVGGAIGNLIDRLFRGEGWLRGGVVDFIDFQWFPIFNVADMAITIGGAILLLNAYLHREPSADDGSPDADHESGDADDRSADERAADDEPGDDSDHSTDTTDSEIVESEASGD